MEIVVLDGYTLNPGDLDWNALQALGNVTIYPRTASELTIERAQNANAVLTNKVVLDADTIDELPNLQYIGVLATGTNVVDLEYAKAKDVVVTNIPKYSTESVVQSTFAQLLNFATALCKNAASTRAGNWSRCQDFSYTSAPIFELSGKTLGILGYGAIGKRVAQIANAFGMNVIVFSPRLSLGSRDQFATAVSLDDLFARADFLTLHCPLKNTTEKIVNAERINQMKNGAYLVNTGRGALIDETAVANALHSGKLSGFGADVLSTEPPQKDNPLIDAPNAYITPHNAWATLDARVRLMKIAVDNLAAFIKGEPVNVVN